ncbi:restriction endonuclease [Leptospira interrogans]|uniref:Restriction system protein n=1 Tax=Leptospira interrogans serovar Hardjo str. Norma TaxID=1279460 RepID=A0A0M4NTN5_LEPIR|nr:MULTISPECIES: restriction endonuclease [Leptospira]ALE38024.1 restriction system protein [Leptospira interrogans serovar Hardjo str. Norma]ALN99380.1 restriction endonuclease [Leptospira interrogans serovar Hardjo-prajitno]EKO04832.1 restriction endonuclease [Leptospira interrogans str. C10069]EKO97388.1 restriction endonuclease [Leptospira interrogans str. Brem 329]EKR19123.1 restriction endonuclease [Leptospira interrogans serovar Pyrogenes str. 2006006960]
MSIPDFQSAMLPILKILNEKRESSTSTIRDGVAIVFKTTEQERRELLPSGKTRIFDNRVAWSITYLKMAGLIQSPKRSFYSITNEGSQFLKTNPERIDNNVLQQFESFQEKKFKTNMLQGDSLGVNEYIQTPDEMMETGYSKIRKDLAEELLNKIKSCNPYFFESIVLDLLIKLGYGGSDEKNKKVTKKSNDEGIDGIIKEDKLGLDLIYVQAKKWENPVSGTEIQKFAGALQVQRAKKGIFITTSMFTTNAHEYVSKMDSKIVLIDGAELTDLMIEYNVGVSTKQTYEIKKVDLEYFNED